MRVMTRWLALAAVLAGVLLPGTRGEAFERKPLPAFDLTALDGLLVRSDQLPRPGRWLLVYVQGDCFACDALLDLFQDPGAAGPSSKVVVVAKGAAEDVARLSAQFPHLGQASWYADNTGAAYDQLQLRGAPIVLGLREGTIDWNLSGFPAGSGAVQSILATWLAN